MSLIYVIINFKYDIKISKVGKSPQSFCQHLLRSKCVPYKNDGGCTFGCVRVDWGYVECSKNVVLAIMLNTGRFLSAFGAATLEGFTFPDYNLVH